MVLSSGRGLSRLRGTNPYCPEFKIWEEHILLTRSGQRRAEHQDGHFQAKWRKRVPQSKTEELPSEEKELLRAPTEVSESIMEIVGIQGKVTATVTLRLAHGIRLQSTAWSRCTRCTVASGVSPTHECSPVTPRRKGSSPVSPT